MCITPELEMVPKKYIYLVRVMFARKYRTQLCSNRVMLEELVPAIHVSAGD